jgi:SAM-dependent methyltransferase
MQTPAEQFLIAEIIKKVSTPSFSSLNVARLINIGANKSVVVEDALVQAGKFFDCDRVDVEDCSVFHAHVKHNFVASVELMPAVPSSSYDVAFANYVLEHVADISAAAKEIHRVLRVGGYFIVSTPNPTAPEFMLAKFTPHAFHQAVKGKEHAHETEYAYKNIMDLQHIFEQSGFVLESAFFRSFTYGYLNRFWIIGYMSKLYDACVNFLNFRFLMGNVALVFKKSVE